MRGGAIPKRLNAIYIYTARSNARTRTVQKKKPLAGSERFFRFDIPVTSVKLKGLFRRARYKMYGGGIEAYGVFFAKQTKNIECTVVVLVPKIYSRVYIIRRITESVARRDLLLSISDWSGGV